jgi:hypothetical protein
MTDYSGGDDNRPTEVPFPGKVLVAGILWIMFGGLALVSVVVTIVLSAAAAAGAPPRPGEHCGNCCSVLFGIAFLWVGFTTVKGTAKDTLGNAIGSLVFGLIYLGLGLLAGLGGAVGLAGPGGPGGPPAAAVAMMSTIMLVVAVMAGLIGSGLVGAGVLAIMGREQYREWREVHAPKKRSRRAEFDDDYDDRDDR